jgi:His-Xaa-Ser system protein HxsD
MDPAIESGESGKVCTEVSLDPSLFSAEVVLKACYWLSRDFACELTNHSAQAIRVTIVPRHECSPETLAATKETFLTSVIDFALRAKVEAKTSDVRDLLLAKAFSESGVLEDAPQGVFGDKVEQEKSHGMFTILGNAEI